MVTAPGAAPLRLRRAERVLAERTRSLTVVLDHLRTPLNASAVLRTAEAFGLQELHLVDRHGRPVPMADITLRAHRWVDLHWYRSTAGIVASLRDRGFRILAAAPGPDAVPFDEVALDGSTALVFGNERDGISTELLAAVDARFFLPATGFVRYVNLSAAVAMSVHAIDRRMRAAGLRRGLDDDDRRALRRA